MSRALDVEIESLGQVQGFTSLAEGADQLFAECVVNAGGVLALVIPCADYESTFTSQEALSGYRRLLNLAEFVEELSFGSPSEEAFWQAGRRIVENCERLIAVWDGEPSGGLGGTADVVAYAAELGRPVTVIWPRGSAREQM